MVRPLPLLVLLAFAGCNRSIYTVDGVTDGDTFYLSQQATFSDDPAVQSWVTYSLARSACQLEVGGPIPSRVSTYGCEFQARELLLERWDGARAGDPGLADRYLDELAAIRDAGYLDEYVVHYFGRKDWQVPAEVNLPAFDDWRRAHLRGHRPVTRITGSWNYADAGRTIEASPIAEQEE